MNSPTHLCPLCAAPEPSKLFTIGGRSFFECVRCDLLFASPDCLLSPGEEKARYEHHHNDPTEPTYLRHLSRIKIQLEPHLPKGARGLDFGCGPTPALGDLFSQSGFPTDSYDPFFGPSLPTPAHQYDFVACTEAAEHFRDPNGEFRLIQSLVKPNGWLAIMTNLRNSERRDASWWYLRDQTHRCFYSQRTFEMIGSMFNWTLKSILDDVVIFRTN